MNYLDEIKRGMNLLASYDAIFVGQAVKYPGTGITSQLAGYPDQLLEMPVAEEFQMGLCIGLALTGKLPVCIYPRSNFAILAMNQIVNHLDKWEEMGGGAPKVIIKVAVGSSNPLDPGSQHKANYAQGFRDMCENIEVYDLIYPHVVYNSYNKALTSTRSSILIEHADLYTFDTTI